MQWVDHLDDVVGTSLLVAVVLPLWGDAGDGGVAVPLDAAGKEEEHYGYWFVVVAVVAAAVAVGDDTPVAGKLAFLAPLSKDAAFQSLEGRPKMVEHSPWSGQESVTFVFR